MKVPARIYILLIMFSQCSWLSCMERNGGPSKASIDELSLKRGELISCGNSDKEFGLVDFELSCNASLKKEFDLAMELLHSFEYDESEKIFSKIIDQDPGCSMAYWGVAMSNIHPLWIAPGVSELQKGSKAISLAKRYTNASSRESDYIQALGEYYRDWEKTKPQTRNEHLENAMRQLAAKYPADPEAAILYALALIAAADPGDKQYIKQKQAGEILLRLYPKNPNHPGIIHYLIHTYDYPGLAELALPEARKYAKVAPSSAHALHMPSHIFTRLGLWDESIQSNLASVAAANCYASSAGFKGHWDEELHGMDYLVYAYLQKGQTALAKRQVDSIQSFQEVYPINFKVAYAFAAIPSRYYIENRLWKEAAGLKLHPSHFPWSKFSWQEALFHFARSLGAVRSGQMGLAKNELVILQQLRDSLERQQDAYDCRQVEIQIKSVQAWVLLKTGKKKEGLMLMNQAANMEDSTEKHPVTPVELIPARELLGDMQMDLNEPRLALVSYEKNLKKAPNRRNGLKGAILAAEKLGDSTKAAFYLHQLNGLDN